MFKRFQEVTVRKMAAVQEPKFNTPSWDQYNLGMENYNASIPIAYEVVGTLENDLVVDSSLIILRSKRNGVEVPGIMETSKVMEITEFGFKTQNSEYQIELVQN